MNRTLQNGQHIALRIANGHKERELSGVVQSFDPGKGLICLEIGDRSGVQGAFFAGKEVTIVGRASHNDLDLPCVVVEETQFPILVCRKVDRRNHVRVSAFLHLKYRPVEREVYKADPESCLIRIREEMGNSEGSFEAVLDEVDQESLNPKLLCLLAEMNRKLDRILASLEEDHGAQPQGLIPVNISGSGVRFTVREKMEARKILAIRIVLPFSPPVPVVFLGEVTRVREKAKGEFEIAVKFVTIDETDREQIVHYGFKRLRESIRNERMKTPKT